MSDRPSDDRERFTRRLKGHRTDLHPDVVPTVHAWLLMHAGSAESQATAVLRAAGPNPDPQAVATAGGMQQTADVLRYAAVRSRLPFSRERWAAAERESDGILGRIVTPSEDDDAAD